MAKTEGAEVEPLEKLYALLAQCIYRHRNTCNKTELIKVHRLHKARLFCTILLKVTSHLTEGRGQVRQYDAVV